MFWLLPWKLLLLAVAGVVGVAIALHRRSLKRHERELADDLETLANGLEGGRPDNPIVVPSAAVVEGRGRDQECLACGEKRLEIEHHETEVHDGDRLRVLHLACAACGAARRLYVRIQAAA